ASNPRNVEQVVDKPDKLAYLAIHHGNRRQRGFTIVAAQLYDLHSGTNRSEGVAKLVGEHRQEFIVAPIRILERLLYLNPFGDVFEDVDCTNSSPLVVV